MVKKNMDKISRREFLKVVGGGTVALAGGAMLTSMGLPTSV